MRLLEFWLNHRTEFFAALAEHLALALGATLIAVVIGVPLGVLAQRRQRLGTVVIGLANIVQTIPSLALFGFLIPLPLIGGIGAKAALIALILYALLPVMRTTLSGLRAIDPVIREAALALGMTDRQMLWQIELPLALGSIIAGIRVATVVGVGTATIAAAIGAGGLGEFIFRGVASVDNVVILAGAIPAAALALLADFSLGWLEKRMQPGRARRQRSTVLAVATVVATALLLIFGSLLWKTWSEGKADRIVVGAKDFAEQLILGELLAQAIERGTNLQVTRKFNLSDTLICDTAMRAGELDVYVEYTGTALTTIFKQPILSDMNEVNRRVAAGYAATGRTMLPSLGFNNTFVMLIRGADARRLNVRTLSDAALHAPNWRAGFGHAFMEREDGFRGLVQTYGLRFAAPPTTMNLSLTYRALAEGQVDFAAGDATNGLIDKLDLFALEDDKHYFPPYEAVPVVRAATLQTYPQVRAVLERLGGKISAQEMRR
ncbi:MAG TPA: ABC transporter permease/substrate-binding protein, partial [Blastocatellia bacterium]|nr:ABC transporter permease/substrate-binding protein [Blastocatellia bacterium]